MGISRQVAAVSRATKSHLFLYSGYALEAFIDASDEPRKKLLFVYHPQGDYVKDVLAMDFALHPEVAESHQDHLREIELMEGSRFKEEIELADAIICASTFSAASIKPFLCEANKKVAVVPYGCHVTSGNSNLALSSRQPKFLFVGQGTQRKGLHHLLKVWRDGGFHKCAELTLVVNKLDLGIGRLIDTLPTKPIVLSNLTREELTNHYRQADVFVMPSLVEGFGLVYLEAMAEGCFVIGTKNTILPDFDLPKQVGEVITPGDLTELQLAIHNAVSLHKQRELSREYIRNFSSTKSWEEFRHQILEFAIASLK